jgi:hypothetical protein
MFRVVLPPIVRSAYYCIYSIWYLSHRYCFLPLSWKSWNWFEWAVGGANTRCCRYSCLRSWWWVMVDCVWNVMAHAQKPDFVFRRNGRVDLNRRGRYFNRLLAGELCTSACRVCTVRASLCSAVMWRLLATHCILLFLFHFSSRASPCTITFQLDSTTRNM